MWLLPYTGTGTGTGTREVTYIGGRSQPSIADLLAYVEIAQCTQMSLLLDYSGTPVLQAWLDAMAGLPYHDDVHASLSKLNKLRLTQKKQQQRDTEEGGGSDAPAKSAGDEPSNVDGKYYGAH